MEKNNISSKKYSLRYLALVGVLAGLTYLLYLPILRIPVILFLEINLSEIVMFIGGFSLGPIDPVSPLNPTSQYLLHADTRVRSEQPRSDRLR